MGFTPGPPSPLPRAPLGLRNRGFPRACRPFRFRSGLPLLPLREKASPVGRRMRGPRRQARLQGACAPDPSPPTPLPQGERGARLRLPNRDFPAGCAPLSVPPATLLSIALTRHGERSEAIQGPQGRGSNRHRSAQRLLDRHAPLAMTAAARRRLGRARPALRGQADRGCGPPARRANRRPGVLPRAPLGLRDRGFPRAAAAPGFPFSPCGRRGSP